MPFADVNGIKICYESKGQGDPVILVHGFGSKKETWIAQFEPLSEHFRVIIFDNRGAGKSDRPDGPYTMEMFADDIRGLMDNLEIKKTHLIGWSLGGMIVQEFVLKYPNRVNKVVLINTSYTISNNLGDTQYREMYVKMKMNDLELLKQDYVKSFWNSAKMSYYYKFRKQMQADPKRKFYGLWSTEEIMKERAIDPPTQKDLENQANALSGFNFTDKLKQIKNDVLLIAASHDRILAKDLMVEMHKRIPNSEFNLIEKAGHSSPRERAPEVNQTIINFLKNKV